ncbi:MAG: methionyl-tRNA formyltransferase [Nibricoccus sp.]
MSPLRIVFLGSDSIALPLLNWLAGEGGAIVEVVGVFTQPDKPVGRGQKITANAIKTWALAKNIPVFQPGKLTEDVRLQLATLNADVGLVMAYGHILRDDFIATPRLGMINLHASLLPKYRGASPIQTAIANGESETGVSLMRIVRRLDAGPVADVERVVIDKHDTAIEVEAKLAAACVPLVVRNLEKLRDGTLVFTPQEDSSATFCRKLTKEDGSLDFTAPAKVLAARINGLFPWPSCSVEMSGQHIKIGLVEAVMASAQSQPGAVVKAEAGDLVIQAGDGQLKLLRLQRPGGKMLPVSDFLRGFPLAPGDALLSKPMPMLVAREPFRSAKKDPAPR